jgi:transposase
MADAMHDARQDGGSYRRIEVITGQRRRRRWTAQEKARIVAESFEEGANISEVARRNGVVRGLLHRSRQPRDARPKTASSRATTHRPPSMAPIRLLIPAQAAHHNEMMSPAVTE